MLQFTVNTPVGPPQRSHMSVVVWVWRAVVPVHSWSWVAINYEEWKDWKEIRNLERKLKKKERETKKYQLIYFRDAIASTIHDWIARLGVLFIHPKEYGPIFVRSRLEDRQQVPQLVRSNSPGTFPSWWYSAVMRFFQRHTFSPIRHSYFNAIQF